MMSVSNRHKSILKLPYFKPRAVRAVTETTRLPTAEILLLANVLYIQHELLTCTNTNR